MAGYYNYSMSNNAIAAYQDGERPLSKWTKADILRLCGEKAAMLKQLTVKELREHLLFKSSWHHTSKYFNATDFFSFDEDELESITAKDVEFIISCRPQKSEKKPVTTITAEVKYTHWRGSRNHPRPVECVEIVTYKSTDKMVLTNNGNKRLSSLIILNIINQ